MNDDTPRRSIRHLVMVDDDVIDRMIHRRIVERSGLVENLHDFGSADAALAFLSSSGCPPIDAIVADINMPRMNGFEFLDEFETLSLRKRELAASVVAILTTSLDPGDERRARRSRAVKDVFHKPFDPEHLRRIAERLEG